MQHVTKPPTLELNVAVDQADAVHELDCFGQFAEYTTEPRFIQASVVLVRIDQVEKFATINMLEGKAVVSGCRERCNV
jgi:hypothetical protein